MRFLILGLMLAMTAFAGCSDNGGSDAMDSEGSGSGGGSGAGGGGSGSDNPFGGDCHFIGDDGHWSVGCTPGSYDFQDTFSCTGDASFQVAARDGTTFTGSVQLLGPSGSVLDEAQSFSDSFYLSGSGGSGTYTAKGSVTVDGDGTAGFFSC